MHRKMPTTFSANANSIDPAGPDFPLEANIRCRAFTGEGVRINRVRVDADGSILVWDCVAQHFTRRHTISERQSARIIGRVRRAIRG